MEDNSILVEIPPLEAVFLDFILIGFQPVIPAIVTLFSDKPCFAYEISCDHCSCFFRWRYTPQCPFLEPEHIIGIFFSQVMSAE